MVNGRGWICVALVVFASWRPGKALLGALLIFAFCDALQLRLQQAAAMACVPYQFYSDAAVRLLSILALVLVARQSRLPAGLDETLPQRRALSPASLQTLVCLQG